MGFRAPLLTQLLTCTGSVGPGAMSGRSVPAEMPFAIWLVESRLVVMWTLIPLDASNGLRTSWNALSSAPPHAVQTVTSVDEALWLLFPVPPEEQATSISAPRPDATAREPSLARTPVIGATPPNPLLGTFAGPVN